jgi:hypothetical protein
MWMYLYSGEMLSKKRHGLFLLELEKPSKLLFIFFCSITGIRVFCPDTVDVPGRNRQTG